MAQRKRDEGGFEELLQKLEAIVKQLEEEEIPLEKSLKLFAEGQTLARACEERLKTAEIQIRKLLEKNGEIVETEFSAEEELAVETAQNGGENEAEPEEPAPPQKEETPAPKNEPKPASGHGMDELPF